jgi:hypothetical protein
MMEVSSRDEGLLVLARCQPHLRPRPFLDADRGPPPSHLRGSPAGVHGIGQYVGPFARNGKGKDDMRSERDVVVPVASGSFPRHHAIIESQRDQHVEQHVKRDLRGADT